MDILADTAQRFIIFWSNESMFAKWEIIRGSWDVPRGPKSGSPRSVVDSTQYSRERERGVFFYFRDIYSTFIYLFIFPCQIFGHHQWAEAERIRRADDAAAAAAARGTELEKSRTKEAPRETTWQPTRGIYLYIYKKEVDGCFNSFPAGLLWPVHTRRPVMSDGACIGRWIFFPPRSSLPCLYGDTDGRAHRIQFDDYFLLLLVIG